ncbi:DUF2182 domain-containing protein [Deinococcus yavapaiensis]|uniref:Putative metal-binding integral membrane protein DUF2182 n=1 Tax=Deinococcus yavapaiensis KR-236 TaxID=694435 RepID=A0A318S2B0_9DEIO|nr:DUF2182 domain-containing protein [Deinococcus yavapaiensis]PYE52056.1 putative metal-binding integral membrane protein DUF2182 [Deinococcus yavapaiensis KR-236]
MSVAMMLPFALVNARHVVTSSLWPRRLNALGVFTAGFLVVWTAVQFHMSWMAVGLSKLVDPAWLKAAAVVGAVAWMGASKQRQRRQHCLQTVPLAPRGWRAHASCLSYGLRTARACVLVCGPLMAVATVFHHAAWTMLAVFGLQCLERFSSRSTLRTVIVVLGVLLLVDRVDFMLLSGHTTH